MDLLEYPPRDPEPVHYGNMPCTNGRQALRLSTFIIKDVRCPDCKKRIAKEKEEMKPKLT